MIVADLAFPGAGGVPYQVDKFGVFVADRCGVCGSWACGWGRKTCLRCEDWAADVGKYEGARVAS
jgi:hypothetical protein